MLEIKGWNVDNMVLDGGRMDGWTCSSSGSQGKLDGLKYMSAEISQ